MLVSTILTNAMARVTVANTSFYTSTLQLQDAQLAWKIIYAFLCENDDDYFVQSIYIPGGSANGNSVTLTDCTLNETTGITVSSTTGIYQYMTVTDSLGLIPVATLQGSPISCQVESVNSSTSITMSQAATGSSAVDTLTFSYFTADPNRNYTYLFALPYDFYRLRLIQYESATGDNSVYIPFNKMTIQNFGASQNAPGYRMVGTNLQVYDPQQYPQYCIWYYPPPLTLTTSTDLSYPNNMIPEAMEFLIAAEIRRMQHEDPTPWLSKADDLMKTMRKQRSRDDATAIAPKNIFDDYFGLWNL